MSRIPKIPALNLEKFRKFRPTEEQFAELRRLQQGRVGQAVRHLTRLAEQEGLWTHKSKRVQGDVNRLLEKKPSEPKQKKRKRGRPKGTSYEAADERLILEMRKLVLSKKVTSIAAASRRVAEDAEGNATLHSKAERLARGYARRFP